MAQKKYEKYYSEKRFWSKINELPTTAPFCILMETAISFFLILKDSSTPLPVRSLLVFCLGYFICPIDVIFDFSPLGVGYTDDLALMTAVGYSIHRRLRPEMKDKIQDHLPVFCKGKKDGPIERAGNLDSATRQEINDIIKRAM